MEAQVAFGAPDGWPTYSRTAHSTWKLAGIVQDIQPEPRSHELCFSHVYINTLGFQSLLPRLDTFNTFFKRRSNDHKIVCKEQLQATPHPLKSLDKASSTMRKSRGLRTEPWWTPTPTSNSSPYSEPTLNRLCALLYIACTRLTIHSSTPTFLITHHKTIRGTFRSNAFSRSTKAKNSLFIEIFPGQEFLLELLSDEYSIGCTSSEINPILLTYSHTRQIISDRHFVSSMYSDKVCTMMIMRCCNVQKNWYDLQAKTYPTICTHHKLHYTNENKFPVFPECMYNKWQNVV